MKNNDGELFRLGGLVCKLPGGLLAKVARSKFKRELEILNSNIFTQAKEIRENISSFLTAVKAKCIPQKLKKNRQ